MTIRSVLAAARRVLPVVSLSSPDEAAPVAAALLAGGLPVAEVTLRTADALEGLRALAAVGGVAVGAGTVRTARDLELALDAGASFVVTPCLTQELAAAARSAGVPFLPGVATPSELQVALDHGWDVVKLFPAEVVGGLAAVDAFAAPFPDACFVPTGGITGATAAAYLSRPQVLAVGGSWMLPADARRLGDWDSVRAAVVAAVRVADAAGSAVVP